jgi:pyridoxal phosphate enzyme (YggS family)
VNTEPASLQDRLELVRARIAAAERRSGRTPGGVTLIGVVKTQPSEAIAAAVELGLRDLGENRVQEAELHQQRIARTAARWHMIGHLQRNKAGKALPLFDLVHGVDDAELGEALAQRARAAGRRVPVLVEVNVSGEGSKFGVAPDDLPALLERLAALDGIELRGLMTVGAPVGTPADARGGFAHLRGLRDDGERRLGRPLPELSMGMSGDYEVAVEEGATLVRVGTAIFGERSPKEK